MEGWGHRGTWGTRGVHEGVGTRVGTRGDTGGHGGHGGREGHRGHGGMGGWGHRDMGGHEGDTESVGTWVWDTRVGRWAHGGVGGDMGIVGGHGVRWGDTGGVRTRGHWEMGEHLGLGTFSAWLSLPLSGSFPSSTSTILPGCGIVALGAPNKSS